MGTEETANSVCHTHTHTHTILIRRSNGRIKGEFSFLNKEMQIKLWPWMCVCLFVHYVMIFFCFLFFSIFIKGSRSNFLRNINCSIDLLANVHTQWFYSRKNQTEVTVFHSEKKKTFTIQIMFFHRRCKTDVYRVLFDETTVLDS